MNNLHYTLEINYTNNSGLNTSVSVKFYDSGLEVKSVKVGDVCVTEETINGRVLSGRIDNADGYCGYRYDYQNGEYLLNINPKTPINSAVNLINKTKMESSFMAAKMVLSSVLRGDYRVVSLNKGNLNVVRSLSAENENAESYSLQESTDLLKLDGEESFTEQSKQTIYKIGDAYIESNDQTDDETKLHFAKLTEIFSQNPQNYKDLIEIKNQVQSNPVNNLVNEEQTL